MFITAVCVVFLIKFKGISHWETVGNFISQDTKQLWGSQASSMLLQRNRMTSPTDLRAFEILRIFEIKTLNFLIELDKAQNKCKV